MKKTPKKIMLLLVVCALSICVCASGLAQEIIYEAPAVTTTSHGGSEGSAAASGAANLVTEAPDTHAQRSAPPASGSAAEALPRTYWLSFFDLEGNRIMAELLEEGAAVLCPDFMPERQGLVFQYWYDPFTYDQSGTPIPFPFGGGIYSDLSLVPFYYYAPAVEEIPWDAGHGAAVDAQAAERLMLDMLAEEAAHTDSISATEPASAISDAPATILLTELLRQAEQGEAAQPPIAAEDVPTLPSEEAAFPSDDNAPVVVFEDNAKQDEMDELGVLLQDQTNNLIDEILAEGRLVFQPDASAQADTAGAQDPVTESKEQPKAAVSESAANALLEEILYTSEGGESSAQAGVLMLEEMPPPPTVKVVYSYEGELQPGTLVTVTANVYNIDPSLTLHYQWENNASGSFQPVPGANGRSHGFSADESNTNCVWRVNIIAN